MKKQFKWALTVALVVMVVAVALYSVNAPFVAELTLLEPQAATLTFVQQGSYTYERTYLLYPLLAGEVLEVSAREGDAISPGDALATLSATDYESQILQLEATVRAYEAQIAGLDEQEQMVRNELQGTLGSLEGQLTSIRAQMEQRDESEESRLDQVIWQRDIVRQDKELVDLAEDTVGLLEGMLSNPALGASSGYGDYLAAEAALSGAKKAYAASQLQLEMLYRGEIPPNILQGQAQSVEAQIAAVNARLSTSYHSAMTQYYNAMIDSARAGISQLENQLGYADITSPVSGVISALPLRDRNLVSQQEPVAEIGIGEAVEVFVPTREIDAVAPGDTVELVLDKRAGEEIIPGEVVFVENKAQVKLSALGVEERKVRVLVRPEDPGLLTGSSMDVRFTLYRGENCLVAPKTALFTDSGVDYVWAVRGGKAVRQAVEKGMELREGYVILSGLSAGEHIVTDANEKALSEGKRVAG